MKLRKIDFWAVGALLAGLLALVLVAAGTAHAADTIDREYQAVSAAQRTLAAAVGCAGASIAMANGYSVGEATKYGKADVVYITGYRLRASCNSYLAKAPSNPQASGTALSWTAPTARANGSALAASEIAGYQLFAMGGIEVTAAATKVADLPSVTAHAISGLAPGTYHYRLRTIDSAGLVSSLSDLVTVTVR